MTIHRPGLAAESLKASAEPEAVKATEPEEAATVVTANPLQQQDGEKELLEAATRIEKGPVEEWSDEAPTQVRLAAEAGAPAPPAPPTVPTVQEPPRGSAPKPAPASGRAPNDMLLALAGTFASAGGALLLATNTAGHGGQRMFGLGIALWGALTCLFLLVTGNMWRQKGNMPISFALATVLAIGGAGFVEVALHGADLQSLVAGLEMPETKPPDAPPAATKPSAEDALADATEDAEADPDGEGSTEKDPEAGTATDEDGDAAADAAEPEGDAAKPKGGAAAPSGDREVPEEVAEDPEALDEPDIEELESDSRDAAEERRRKEMEAAATAASERRTRRDEERTKKAELEAAKAAARAAAAERAAPPPPPPAAASPTRMKTLPLTVVDTLIRTNLSVKKCFFEEKNRSGTLPHRVAVRFTILTSGQVTSARVITDQYKGTPLDSCLGRSFKAIRFPAFEGETISMTYPFVL